MNPVSRATATWSTAELRRGEGAFRLLWFGQSLSQLGSQMSLVAIPLVATLVLRASAWEIGLLVAFELVPHLLTALPAGVLVDRVDRRRLLIVTDIGRALVLLTVPLAFVTGVLSMGLLLATALILGTLGVIFDVAYQSYLPELLPADRLIDGNQKLELSDSAAQVVGPSVGGLLVGSFGGALAVLLDAVSYGVSAVALLKSPHVGRSHAGPSSSSVGASIAVGFRVVLGTPVLRDLALSTAIFNFASGMIASVFILFATREIGLDAAGFGLLYGLGNVGFVLGAASCGMLSRLAGAGRTLFFAGLLGAAATVLLPMAAGATAVLLLVAGRFIGAVSAPLFNVNVRTIRQCLVTGEALGRVNATFRFVDWGFVPLGALLGGAIGDSAGFRATLAIAAGFGVLSAAWLMRSPARRLGMLGEEGPPSTGFAIAPVEEAAEAG